MASAPVFIPEALYGVIGWPLGQSLSPLLHNAGFQALGLPAAYLRWEIPPGELGAFVDSMRLLGIRGASVTIPHKTDLLPLLDAVSEQAGLAGAVNTIYRDGAKLCGENTDVTGFLSPLAGFDAEKSDALLLGAGGAARAAAVGLTQRRFRRIYVATPSDKSHAALAEQFSCTALRWEERHDVPADLVINATPLGMYGRLAGETPYDFGRAAPLPEGRVMTAYDLVYNPRETRFLREAGAHGHCRVSGLDMFLGQGAAQFQLWTGQKIPAAATAALRAKLGAAEKSPAETLR